MTKTIHAICENGVFRPTEAVDLPDHCEVEFEVRSVKEDSERPTLDDVYSVLTTSFDGGQPDDASNHSEHSEGIIDASRLDHPTFVSLAKRIARSRRGPATNDSFGSTGR